MNTPAAVSSYIEITKSCFFPVYKAPQFVFKRQKASFMLSVPSDWQLVNKGENICIYRK